MAEREMTMREALNLALDEALAADDRVFLLGEDIADPGASGPTAGLSTKYGHDRVLDTPISEAAIVGAGLRLSSVEEIGQHYIDTLRRWRERFLANAAAARALGLRDRDIRTWEFYLAGFEASFRVGLLRDYQFVLEKVC